jgi:peroxiredoxin
VLLPLAIALGAAGLLSSAGSPSTAELRVVGDAPAAVAASGEAPRFRLPPVHGRGMVHLQVDGAHPVVVSFWASWCGPCRDEASYLRRAYRSFRPEGVRFVGIDHRDSLSSAREFLARERIPYPSAFDPGGSMALRYAAIGLPTTFVVGADGEIAYRITGRVDGDNLRWALSRVLDRRAGRTAAG